MRQTRTRILSLLVALVMCLGLLPVTALAAGGSNGEPTLFLDPNQAATLGTSSTGAWITPPLPGTILGEVIFHMNGAGEDQTVSVKVEDSSVTPPQDPTLPGYRFLGWYTGNVRNDQYLYDYISIDNYHVDGGIPQDLAFYAMWEKEGLTGFTITFNPNGGNVSPTSKQTGPDGRVSGGYPTPTREGYTFLGWFTDGDGYQPADNEIWSGNQTLVAKWERSTAAARVTFYPNGGRITKFKGVTVPEKKADPGPFYIDTGSTGVDMNSGWGWTNTEDSGLLPATSLPSVEREGYTFDGWYIVSGPQANQAGDGKLTDFTGLSQLGTAPFFPQGVELAAKWTATDVCTVTFNYNNRTGKTEQIKIAKGDTIKLPQDPVWAKHTFQGWISGDIVGNEIINAVLWTEESKVTKDITLFATWAEGEADETLKGLTYRFGNNRPAFRYSESYEIPQIRYEMVLGKTQGEWIYKYYGRGWGGNCYGMAATSGMFFHGNGSTTTASFRSGAEVPYDLSVTDRNGSLNMSLTEYIEAVFVSQYARVIQSDYGQQADLNSLASSVKTVRSTRAPVMIAIRGEAITERGEHVNSGHAVLGYDIIDVNSTESRLMIYDPNFPNTERYITLKKSGNNYVSWAYKLNDMYDWGTGRTYNSISVVPYSDYSQAWNNRAVHSNDPALFSTNAINASILDGTGKIVATIKDGTVSTSNSDITPILTYGVTSDGTIPVSSGSCMWLPAGQYTIQTSDSSGKELEATLADVNQSATVSTAAKSVTFVVNDNKALNYVQIDQAGAKYDITLFSTLDQGHESVQLAGTTASGGVSLAQISGSLYATGVNSGAALKVNGKSAATSTLSNNMPDIGNLPTGTEKPTGTNPFTDVKSGAYYYDAVLWAVEKKITSGTSATTFSPNNPCTRGQIVTFLWRAAGSPKPTSSNNPFIDVKAGAYYYDAVLWAVEKGITSGTSATTFSPNTVCTRGQTVTFLWRAAGSPKAASSTNPFSDVQSGAYYYDAVLWAVEQKVTSGTSATTFAPGSTVTRGQTVTFLYRSQGK